MSTHRHAQLLLEQLNKQRNQGFICDCTVIVGQTRYLAHRNVLAAFSEFFSSRCAHEVITLDPEWVSETTFRTLLTFVYTGNLIISNEDVSDIRKAAAFLGMQEALNQCDLLCPNEEKPSLDAIIQACNAMAAAEAAAAEATATAAAATSSSSSSEEMADAGTAEGSSPSQEPVAMLPSLQEVEETEEGEEEQVQNDQRDDQDGNRLLSPASEPSKELTTPTAKKRGRKPKPKPDAEPDVKEAVKEEVSSSGRGGRGRGRPRGRGRGRGRGRPPGSGRGRGRPAMQTTVEPLDDDEPSDDAQPSGEAEAEADAETAVASMDDHDSTLDGENSDPLNLASTRKSHRKRVPSKKLRESGVFPEDVIMEEEGGEEGQEADGGDAEAEEDFMPEESSDDKESLRVRRLLGDKSKPMCSQCGKQFSEISSLRRHQRIHIGLKPYECVLCNRTFRQCNQLKTHLRIHTGEKPFKCDKCDKAFAQKCQLVFHCRMHHGEEKPYQCNDCGLQFATSSNLKIHTRKHSGEKPYKCTVCSKRFAQASTLTYHMRRHTGEKPYVCDTCGRAFAVSSSLITHTRKHAKEKLKREEEEAACNAPYVCLVCGKRFFTTGELRKHMDSHGYKRVKCDICGQMLADANSLKKHKEKKHSVVIEEALTSAALPLNIPIDHQGLIARMCAAASPLDPSDVTEATSVTFEELEIPADAASSLETTQIVIVHTIQAE
ncbi:myoneurin isoform X2 [Engraulis encrasicolus]|uniref:myoneurin isoform X2 n=1 Tax=Engraulis encrasicolus TaxID=184585 RepID=UPI002FD75C99